MHFSSLIWKRKANERIGKKKSLKIRGAHGTNFLLMQVYFYKILYGLYFAQIIRVLVVRTVVMQRPCYEGIGFKAGKRKQLRFTKQTTDNKMVSSRSSNEVITSRQTSQYPNHHPCSVLKRKLPTPPSSILFYHLARDFRKRGSFLTQPHCRQTTKTTPFPTRRH